MPHQPNRLFSHQPTEEFQIPIYSNSSQNKGLYGYTDVVKVDYPCVTVSGRGTIGFAVARNEKFYPIVRLLVLEPHNDKAIIEFMELMINKLDFEISAVGVPQLSVPQISDYGIPLPPKSVQIQIIQEINSIEQKKKTGREKIEKLQNEIEELFTSQLANGSIKKLEEVCEMKAGKFVASNDIFQNSDKNMFPCYGGNGLRGYTKTYTHTGKYSLVGRQGALCGNVHLVEGQFHATEHALVVNPLKDINVDWLYYLLRSLDLNRYATGTAQPGLSVKNINPLQVKILPLAEQEKLVTEIQQLEQEISAMENVLANIDSEKSQVLKTYLQ